jgi:membrane-associated phospholipid phosphatase
MKQGSVILARNSTYYTCCGVFIIVAAIFLLCTTKQQSFEMLNTFHSSFLSDFFSNYTFLGDGIFALSLSAILYLCGQKQAALYVLVAFLSSGVVAQVFKNTIYALRPRVFFEASRYVFELDTFSKSGVGASSFPSGHTTSAFAVATALCVCSKNRFLHMLFFGAAVLVGYSRIYLAQHFPADVLAGAVVGIVMSTVSVMLCSSKCKITANPALLRRRKAALWNNREYTDTAIS